jgi:hypothetical protein
MTEVELITKLEELKLVAFKLVEALIFYVGLWHVTNKVLHVGEVLVRLGLAFGKIMGTLADLINFFQSKK